MIYLAIGTHSENPKVTTVFHHLVTADNHQHAKQLVRAHYGDKLINYHIAENIP